MKPNAGEGRNAAETIAGQIADTPEADLLNAARMRCGENKPLLMDVLGFLGARRNSDPMANQRVGHYLIHWRLGGGGNGDVYLATRTKEPHQQVAIKFLRLTDGDNEEFRRRFVRERQIMALLNHPYIVKFYDADRTKEGKLYFIMEYVEGQHLDKYANGKRLSFSGRIDLFLRICESVQYLHNHLVVHRDLKPANILVRPDGIPKVLDFGIAKLLRPEMFDGAMITMMPVNPLTIQYASPEQWSGGVITSASDVYSLGVILHQLLTGDLPISWKEGDPADYRKAVCSGAQNVASKGVISGQFKLCREASDASVQARLRGDLDSILAKALHVDVNERYATVAALVEDIQRYQQFLPVRARQGVVSYRLKRFVRRNRAWILSIGAVVIALGLGLSSTLIQRNHAQVAEKTAEKETEKQKTLVGRLGQLVDQLQKDKEQLEQSLTNQHLTATSLREAMVREAGELELAIRLAGQYRGEGADDPVREALLGRSYGVLGRLRALSGDTSAAVRAYNSCLAFLGKAEAEGDHSLPTSIAKHNCEVGLAQIRKR